MNMVQEDAGMNGQNTWKRSVIEVNIWEKWAEFANNTCCTEYNAEDSCFVGEEGSRAFLYSGQWRPLGAKRGEVQRLEIKSGELEEDGDASFRKRCVCGYGRAGQERVRYI